jgi:transcriptional regulator GlxA family with amidase domain
MTLRTLRRHWDKYYPVSMKHFVVLKRVDEAKRLLETGSDSIGEIAGFCGFKNPYYFSKKFREIAGVPPLQYRRKTRET